MAKADRLARLDLRRIELEAEYRAALVAALSVTAAGKRGLFDHNGDRVSRAAVAPIISDLTETAEMIDDARSRLGIEPFALHQQFLSARGRPGAQAVGEPKQARAWLDTLAEDAAS